MKKIIASLILFTILAITSTSLEAGVRTRSGMGIQFGTTLTRPAPCVMQRTPVRVVSRPLPVVTPVPVRQETVIVQEVPCYYQETFVYPVPCRRSFGGFSFGFSFFN